MSKKLALLPQCFRSEHETTFKVKLAHDAWRVHVISDLVNEHQTNDQVNAVKAKTADDMQASRIAIWKEIGMLRDKIMSYRKRLLNLKGQMMARDNYLDTRMNAFKNAQGRALVAMERRMNDMHIRMAVVASQQGPPGIPGPDGLPGKPGAQGYPGQRGDRGAPGIIGVTGPRGFDGRDGIPGGIGPHGDMGLPGAMGPAGPPGIPGRRGPMGLYGIAGHGHAGPHGPIGPSGPPGYAGVSGAEGPTGQSIPGKLSLSLSLGLSLSRRPSLTKVRSQLAVLYSSTITNILLQR